MTIHHNVRAPGEIRRRGGTTASRLAVLSVAAVLLGGLILDPPMLLGAPTAV
ncbi:hypothetical protein NG701_00040 [Pseudarthrobacter sp. HLT3-5]|uniref:hypothetical protein n=1 Tax=Pseudarthrobacter cellobiosi TaxID=2953654 RepID=UPI00208F4080|nr:hypothetical protein [Pseudarthrobacter sp. HLT3-5]MCO4272839.1 hypothetical protein [Pseudarthrobacter sp. HLT3-5]